VLLLQGFDEVLSALPPGSNMGNLLLELGQGISAALGVLVSMLRCCCCIWYYPAYAIRVAGCPCKYVLHVFRWK
jgi:hypothetical protein